MTNVVPLRPERAPEIVWKCDCGCQHFWLHADGRIECPDCGTWQDEKRGYWMIAMPPPEGAA